MNQKEQSNPEPRRRQRREKPESTLQFAPKPVSGQLTFDLNIGQEEEEKDDE